MNKQQVVAVSIVALVAIWMFFPRPSTSIESGSEESAQATVRAVVDSREISNDNDRFTVRAVTLTAQEYVEKVRVRGRTQAFRRVDIRAEEPGRIVAIPVVEGRRVAAGDTLCEIAVDTRETDLLEARSRLQQAKVEYEATQNLRRDGLTSEVSLVQSRAAYDSATAAVARAELALENTRIKAPFDGIVEDMPAEIGALLDRGAVCASLLDDDPMLLVGMVPEQQLGKLKLGAPVQAELLTGEKVAATVTYLSRSADSLSRSYRVEATAGQPQGIADGITAEMNIDASTRRAHLIPPSALSLDDNGFVGVKTLNSENVVSFVPVTIIGDETGQVNAGVWVTGLPNQITLITHGQEIVFPGQQVETDFSWSETGRLVTAE